jgi:hypothetical protein
MLFAAVHESGNGMARPRSATYLLNRGREAQSSRSMRCAHLRTHVRSRLVGQRTGVSNQIRERGITVRQGLMPLRKVLHSSPYLFRECHL